MTIILITGAVFFTWNYPESKRTEFIVTAKEFKKNKINKDLTLTDEVVSESTKEDYLKKFKAFRAKMPKAEWNLTEKTLTDAEYDKALDNYYESYDLLSYWYGTGIINSMPSPPSKTKSLPYSMKKFMTNVINAQEIDTTDYDALITLIDKMEHFYSLSDKASSDTLFVKKFEDILSKSKNLTIDEMKSVEKLHLGITKTPLVFSMKKYNSVNERQSELFGLYEAAANGDITSERFVQLDSIAKRLRVKDTIRDTVTVLKVLKRVMEVDFSKLKEKGETGYDLETVCIDDFFKSGRYKYTKEDVIDKFNKYIGLYEKKLEAANLEKRARDILREENREDA
ncbi:MAG: hypothetical protein RIT43_88, partial [Bacteroidota bacterium]